MQEKIKFKNIILFRIKGSKKRINKYAKNVKIYLFQIYIKDQSRALT